MHETILDQSRGIDECVCLLCAVYRFIEGLRVGERLYLHGIYDYSGGLVFDHIQSRRLYTEKIL